MLKNYMIRQIAIIVIIIIVTVSVTCSCPVRKKKNYVLFPSAQSLLKERTQIV